MGIFSPARVERESRKLTAVLTPGELKPSRALLLLPLPPSEISLSPNGFYFISRERQRRADKSLHLNFPGFRARI